MITVVGDGQDGHRIEAVDGTQLGTIRNGAVRLGAFRSERELLSAALPLWSALDAALARQYAGWRRYTPTAPLRLVHDGASEWVSDGRRPLARVVRPAPSAGSRALALEVVLPSYATDGVLISVATALVRALERHAAEATLPLPPAATHAAARDVAAL
jgi:hypothetical protein